MAGAPLIALVAGEASGDNLGAALIAAIRERGARSALHRRARTAHARGWL